MLNKLDMVPDNERTKRVKDFVKRYKWKGPVFEISALTREGCDALLYAIYDHLAETKKLAQRNEVMAESAAGIDSIDADDPRFKV